MKTMAGEAVGRNRRAANRTHVPIVARARRLAGVTRDPFPVGVSDVSRTGMRLECLPEAGVELMAGDRIHVVFPEHDAPEPVAVTGTVVWDGYVRGRNPWVVDATGGRADARWRFGLRFDHEEPDLAHRLPHPGKF